MVTITDVVYAAWCANTNRGEAAADQVSYMNAIARACVGFPNHRALPSNTLDAESLRAINARSSEDVHGPVVLRGPCSKQGFSCNTTPGPVGGWFNSGVLVNLAATTITIDAGRADIRELPRQRIEHPQQFGKAPIVAMLGRGRHCVQDVIPSGQCHGKRSIPVQIQTIAATEHDGRGPVEFIDDALADVTSANHHKPRITQGLKTYFLLGARCGMAGSGSSATMPRPER